MVRTFLIPIPFFLILLGGCYYEEKETIVLSSRELPITSSLPNSAPRKWLSSLLPLPLRISEDFSSKEVRAIQDQADVWEAVIDNEVDFFDYDFQVVENFEPQDFNDYEDDPVQGKHLGIYKSTQWPEHLAHDTLAITQFSGFMEQENQRKYIRMSHADIILNYQHHTFSSNPQYFEFDFASVVIHELGHLLGLRHNTKLFSLSVMRPSLSRQAQRRQPSKSDLKDILKNYGLTGEKAVLEQEYLNTTEGQYVRGVIELKAHGECLHFLNNQLIQSHYIH